MLTISILWCQTTGSDGRLLWRLLRAWHKAMAAYSRVYGFGHLRADCRGPGSACLKYWTTFTLHLPLSEEKETQLPLPNRTAHLCKHNGAAYLLILAHRHIMCYHAEYQRSRSNRISSGEPGKLVNTGTPLSWDGMHE